MLPLTCNKDISSIIPKKQNLKTLAVVSLVLGLIAFIIAYYWGKLDFTASIFIGLEVAFGALVFAKLYPRIFDSAHPGQRYIVSGEMVVSTPVKFNRQKTAHGTPYLYLGSVSDDED